MSIGSSERQDIDRVPSHSWCTSVPTIIERGGCVGSEDAWRLPASSTGKQRPLAARKRRRNLALEHEHQEDKTRNGPPAGNAEGIG
jgi:hypothetical protein